MRGESSDLGVLRAEQAKRAVDQGRPKDALAFATEAVRLIGDDARYRGSALAALGLPDDADTTTVLSAIAELKEAVEERTGVQPQHLNGFRELASGTVEYERRQRELAAETRQREREEERERLLAVAVDEGRIKEGEKDALRVLYAIDPDAARDVLLSVPGADGRRDVDQVINAAGDVVDARTDSDWLHRRATAILANRGITEPMEWEYAEALEAARAPYRFGGRR